MKESSYDLIIRNGQIVTEDGIFQGDIAVCEQKIVQIGSIPSGRKAKLEIDAFGLHVLPGLIDTHVHFNEPGRTDWEGFYTGSRSLAAGGVTTFFDMPLNSSPRLHRHTAFKSKKKRPYKNRFLILAFGEDLFQEIWIPWNILKI
ncbi:amidohydrolase family protein [Geobacillus sp. JS12]|uniref:amidohydrolase family protein n=1 Tax=Geobacillus sp. JS12 TaxID=1813182 RepID=UPI000A6D4909